MANQTVRTALFSMAFATGLSVVAPAGAQPGNGFIYHFDDPELKGWYLSNFSIKDDFWVTGWRRKMITRPGNGEDFVTLGIAPGAQGQDKAFLGSEMQRGGPYHYGRYEVVTRPVEGSGLVSSFFTYTGPYFGDPHDEIDIEFLGRDLSKVWLNKFVDGKKMPGEWIDLGFDAGEKPRLYGFEWSADGIRWFTGDRELLSIDASQTKIPTTPQKLMVNIWAGNPDQAGWVGTTPPGARGDAEYYCISFVPEGEEGPQCSDTFESTD